MQREENQDRVLASTAVIEILYLPVLSLILLDYRYYSTTSSRVEG
jgi:hypothetical protein